MEIKYCEINNYDNEISDEGYVEVDSFDGYELFCKLYEEMEGKGSECGVSKEEFRKEWMVRRMRDWMVIKNDRGMIIFNMV